MSGQCTGWVLRHGPRDRAMRAVLVTIADAANRDGCHAHPGIEAMVDGSLYSKTSVSRILARLIDEGWVEVESAGGGRGMATVYRVPMVKAPHGGEVPQPETSPSDAPKPPHPASETSPSSGKPPHATPSDLRKRNANGLYNVENNGSDTTTHAPASPVVADLDLDDDPLLGFDAFWDVYPRRNGKRIGRRICEGLWARLPLADRRGAWRGARFYADAVGADLTIAKDPERFLKHRVWEDWQEPATPDPPRANGTRPSNVEQSWAAIGRVFGDTNPNGGIE